MGGAGVDAVGLTPSDATKIMVVTGSRDYPRLGDVVMWARRFDERWVLFHGACRGVDMTAMRNWPGATLGYPAHWDRDEEAAGPIRNRQMIRAALEADPYDPTREIRVVAFWDGKSTGTQDCIEAAIEQGLEVEIHGPDGVVCRQRPVVQGQLPWAPGSAH